MIDAATLKTHIAYAGWASARLVEAAGKLSEAELTRDFGTADKSVLGTLVHVFAADRVWLGRIQGNPPARFIDPDADMKLSVLQTDWPALIGRWQAYLDTVKDSGQVIAYKDLKGNPYATPLWQIVFHVVNHGTHHRGQVSGFLRSMGHTPPNIDEITYFRTL